MALSKKSQKSLLRHYTLPKFPARAARTFGKVFMMYYQ